MAETNSRQSGAFSLLRREGRKETALGLNNESVEFIPASYPGTRASERKKSAQGAVRASHPFHQIPISVVFSFGSFFFSRLQPGLVVFSPTIAEDEESFLI
jgi:hypothetical protein